MSKTKSNFEHLSGMWKRTSTNRVGKDGKPEVYYVGSLREGIESVTINSGDKIHLYESTNPNKKGSPKWFLKIMRADGTSEEVEVPIEA
jgi:hypothetical protein